MTVFPHCFNKNDSNGNFSDGGSTEVYKKGYLNPKSNSTDDELSTSDQSEEVSAPTELLAEFLSAVMLRDYLTAYEHCKRSKKGQFNWNFY